MSLTLGLQGIEPGPVVEANSQVRRAQGNESGLDVNRQVQGVRLGLGQMVVDRDLFQRRHVGDLVGVDAGEQGQLGQKDVQTPVVGAGRQQLAILTPVQLVQVLAVVVFQVHD